MTTAPGEIADVVAIRLTENLVSVTLFHCKFSSGDMPGARVKDLRSELVPQSGRSEGLLHGIDSL
jgi:hypothetical protein